MTGNICVFAEQWRGKVSEVAYEALALGRELADALGVKLTAVMLGSNAKHLTQTLGAADQVIYIDHPLLADPPPQASAEALAQAMAAQRPRAVLVPLTNVSLGIGAILAEKLGSGCVNFCKDVTVADGRIRATCVMYGGKIEAAVEAQGDAAVLGLWPGARPAERGHSDRAVAVEEADVTLQEPPIKLRRYIEPDAGGVDLSKIDTLVAVGRGIQSKDNIALAEELAKALGGAVAGSRPVIDQGWLPLSRQVGKSGLTVKPKLYVALGISGAPEHIEGMKDAALIVAVNSDARAPIFNIAHYGIVGDVLETIPALSAAVAAKKAAGGHA